MKRIILSLFMLISITLCFAQIVHGPYTMFPKSKEPRTSYNPKLAFGKIDDQYLLILLYIDAVKYALFDQESVLLLKFVDDSIVKLPISKIDLIIKEQDNEWAPYRTYTSFNINQDVIDKIVTKKQNIKKIRVSFTNGDLQDWDIDLKYQPKLIQGLSESYAKVKVEYNIRKENMNNVEAGF